MKVYRVGGAVRDALLGLPVKDTDWVVVGARVTDMLDAGFQQVGRDFPVFLHPRSKEEYALARTERKSGKGYSGFVVNADPGVTLEEDLLRRDLTINAIAQDAEGRYVDPYGGRADLAARILRHVSSAFTEDPLRVLRVARFAARFAPLGFTIAQETLELMRQLSAGDELLHLSPERVWQEMQRALDTPAPAVFFRVLRDCGALATLLPELDALFGVPQPEFFHPEIDTGVHMLMSLEQASKLGGDTRMRFAALVHDLGKGRTPPALWPAHTGHEETGGDLIEALCLRLRIPNDFRELGVLVSRFHTRCHKALKHAPEQLFETLELCDALRRPERFTLFLQACEADARGRTGLETRAYPQAVRLQLALQAAQQVDAAALASRYQKAELGLAIRQARISAVSALFAHQDRP
jgi:tRNA nucleotidyltransferase (CCA-adding enzyme)